LVFLHARGAGFQIAGDSGHVLGVYAAVEKLPGRRPALDLDCRAPHHYRLDTDSDDVELFEKMEQDLMAA
jgi:hypothetical protein